MSSVKRLQIMIEEELDDALALEARRERTSKAALIRRYVRERLRPNPLPPIPQPITGLRDVVTVTTVDQVATRNRFYGGQIGGAWQWYALPRVVFSGRFFDRSATSQMRTASSVTPYWASPTASRLPSGDQASWPRRRSGMLPCTCKDGQKRHRAGSLGLWSGRPSARSCASC